MKTKHRLSEEQVWTPEGMTNHRIMNGPRIIKRAGGPKGSVGCGNALMLIQELHAELRALHLELERLSSGHSVNLNEMIARRGK
jgi:hypothetical protein